MIGNTVWLHRLAKLRGCLIQVFFRHSSSSQLDRLRAQVVPLIAEHPPKGGQLAIHHSPFEVIPGTEVS